MILAMQKRKIAYASVQLVVKNWYLKAVLIRQIQIAIIAKKMEQLILFLKKFIKEN